MLGYNYLAGRREGHMVKHTGPGKYLIKVDHFFEVVRAWLFNFDIDGSILKLEHKQLLDAAIGPAGARSKITFAWFTV